MSSISIGLKTMVLLLIFLFLITTSYGEMPSLSMLTMNCEPTIEGDPFGHRSMDNIIIYAFSQNNCGDSQLYQLKPDINIRSWQKFPIDNKYTNEVSSIIVKQCHEENIAVIGGGTASVISDLTEFATCSASNRGISLGASLPGCYRASLANPKFRRYLIEQLKKDIAAGTDGLFLDEANTNAGFDDYFISDFNRYLMNKYSDFTDSDWNTIFGMTKENIIRRDVPYNDLKHNFNYRNYLKTHGWTKDPFNLANPLAKEWGRPRINRLTIPDDTFMGKYQKLYWKEIVIAFRTYAREKYGKEIWITSNGIFPFVDFNSLGMYDGNDDNYGEVADYMPVINRHLNGSKSLKSIYLKMLNESKKVSGNVPLVLFIDWPGSLSDRYYRLPKSEKKDFWRIYGAEMYACGVFPAFHLTTGMPGEPSASESGILDFFIEYTRFYKEHKDLYQTAVNTGKIVTLTKENIEYNVTYQEEQNRYLVHLINHNYQRKIMSQTNFTVSLELEGEPVAIKLLTPDGEGSQQVDYQKEQGKLVINVEKIDFYNVLVIQI